MVSNFLSSSDKRTDNLKSVTQKHFFSEFEEIISNKKLSSKNFARYDGLLHLNISSCLSYLG